MGIACSLSSIVLSLPLQIRGILRPEMLQGRDHIYPRYPLAYTHSYEGMPS